LVGKTDAPERALPTPMIDSVALLQAKSPTRRKLDAELRQQFPVTVDEQALAR